MVDYLFEREYRVIGMRRSGNAAINGYIETHFGSCAIFQRNTNFSFLPRRLERKKKSSNFIEVTYKVLQKRAWKEKKPLSSILLDYYGNGIEGNDLPLLGKNMRDEAYEYNVLRHFFANKFKRKRFSNTVKNILILRSPHNNLASILAKGWKRKNEGTHFINMWIEYAEEYLGITNYLGEKFVLNYDAYFANESYRKVIAKMMGVEYVEKGIHRLHGGARGSSFDGNKFQGHAEDMKVLDRWKYFEKNREYLNTLSNKKIIDYTKEIFDIDLKDLINV